MSSNHKVLRKDSRMDAFYLVILLAVLNCLALVAAMHLSSDAPQDTDPLDWQSLAERIEKESQLD